MRLLKQLWNGFSQTMMAVGHAISKYVITPALYYVLGALFTAPSRVGDPLRLRPRQGSHWHRRDTEPDRLDHARSLY